MIEVKIDPVKMLKEIQGQQEPAQQANAPPQQAEPAQSAAATAQLPQIPPNPVVLTGLKSYDQAKSSWDRVFGFLG